MGPMWKASLDADTSSTLGDFSSSYRSFETNPTTRPITSSSIALLFPGGSGVGVAALLPEAGLLLPGEADGPDPLGALVDVFVGHHQAQGPAVLGGQVLAVQAVGQEHSFPQEVLQGRAGEVASLGLYGSKAGLRPGAGQVRQGPEEDPFPVVAQAGPAGDAV